MKRRLMKICAAVCAAALAMQAGAFASFADSASYSTPEEEVAANTPVYSAGAKASALNDKLENSSKKTIYKLSDYKTNDVAVLYKDGSVEEIKCGSRAELESRLAELEADDSVDTYQPNFSYGADAVYETESSGSWITGPVFFGADGDSARIRNHIKERADVNIASAHPVYPADSYYGYQWGLNNTGTFKGVSDYTRAVRGVDINAPEAWGKYKAKRNVTVAVVDTGVDHSNSEISSNMWTNDGEIPDNGIDDDENGYVDDYYGWNFYDNNNVTYKGAEDDHGTHCAGTIAAASNDIGITGVAPYSNIRLMPVKALGGSDGMGTTLTVVKAIKYAEANGAMICNLSLGTEINDSLLYRTMKNSRMLFVVAAGNSENMDQYGWDIEKRPVYPASYTLDNIIAVGNAKANGFLHYTSNFGSVSVDLAAPGTDILGLAAGNRMEYMTGTSMAAPFVTAGAAMVYTNSYSLTLKETRYILINSVKKISSLSSSTASGGMMDLSAALSWD